VAIIEKRKTFIRSMSLFTEDNPLSYLRRTMSGGAPVKSRRSPSVERQRRVLKGLETVTGETSGQESRGHRQPIEWTNTDPDVAARTAVNVGCSQR